MANTPISGLAPGAAVSNTDLFPDVQIVGVGPVKVTGAQIKTFCSATPTLINPTVLSTLTVGAQGSTQGSIVLATTVVGPQPVTVQASNSTISAWTLTLPVGPGTAAQALLTDGAGVSYWGEPPVTTLQGGIASQIPYQSAPNVTSFIANGTAGQYLLSNGTSAPAWSAINLASSSVTGILPTANGGTGLSAIGTNGQALISNGTTLLYGNPANATSLAGGLAGSVPYQSAPNVTTFVGIGNAGTVMTSSGTAPQWGQVNLADNTNAVTGTLAIANGGTGLATVGANGTVPVSNGTSLAYGIPPLASLASAVVGGAASQILYQSSANVTAFIPNGTPGQVLTSNGTIAPSWVTPPKSSYHISVSSSSTIPAAIAAAGITDDPGNFYTFINSSTSNITLTATIVDQSAAYPVNVTPTSVVIPAGGTVGINTVTVGSEYSVDVVSPITGLTTINVTASVTLSASTSIDRYGVIQLSPNATGYTVSIPAPTNTLAGRTITFCNNTPYSVTLAPLNGTSNVLASATSVTLVWNGGSWYGAANLPSGAYTRAYSFQPNANSNWATLLSNAGVVDYDGNVYSLVNSNSTSSITITFGSAPQVWINDTAMSGQTHPANNQIVIRPYETFTFQTYSAGAGTYVFICSTQPQNFTCKVGMGTTAALPANADTTLNFVNTVANASDPMGAFNNSTHAWTCPRAGAWLVTLTLFINNSNSGNATYNTQIRVNNDSARGILSTFLALGTTASNAGASSASTQCIINVARGDSVIATMYPYSSNQLTPLNNSIDCQMTFSLVG